MSTEHQSRTYDKERWQRALADIEDIQFLIHLHQPDLPTVRQIISTFPDSAKERAINNLIYLDILK